MSRRLPFGLSGSLWALWTVFANWRVFDVPLVEAKIGDLLGALLWCIAVVVLLWTLTDVRGKNGNRRKETDG